MPHNSAQSSLDKAASATGQFDAGTPEKERIEILKQKLLDALAVQRAATESPMNGSESDKGSKAEEIRHIENQLRDLGVDPDTIAPPGNATL